ncbi:hypothetical protein FA15DRAFT_662362 [Coprinopsis marcescibilis]|uniref:Uncharacterized protein n=1 Tax=Coprinopsis marcescibilis TaxID=230819 RepID=A0A5C3LC24_COPMA|nr:hypothetical protein FA15DRAFT_662362 [Coprinopsis marcescibilis]
MSHNPVSLGTTYDLRPSPIRGQLEPYDPKAPEGWRYIQTTDTPGELKVLLPPATAAMYEQLLKLETYELTKKSSLSWECLLEIRHLKDRMIRKCQRLVRPPGAPPRKISRGDPFVFQTIVAPSDFRLKEMEKWFRDKHKSITAKASASKPSTSKQELPQHRHSSSKAPLLLRSATNPASPIRQNRPSLKPESQHAQLSQAERSISLPVGSPALATTNVVPSHLILPVSPLPLPILLLSQREEYGLSTERPPISPSERPIFQTDDFEYGKVEDSSGDNSPTSEDNGTSGESMAVRRRRSCIKRSSISDLAKTVSWADGQELDRYTAAARQAQASVKWGEIRTLYMEHIQGLQSLQGQVKEGLNNLRSETEHLQSVDEAIRRQRDSLEQTLKQIEQNYSSFQEKVQDALTESNDTLGRVNAIATLPPINES